MRRSTSGNRSRRAARRAPIVGGIERICVRSHVETGLIRRRFRLRRSRRIALRTAGYPLPWRRILDRSGPGGSSGARWSSRVAASASSNASRRISSMPGRASHCGRLSASSGRPTVTKRTGPWPRSRTWSSNSTRTGSAHWRSSTRRTSGRSAARASTNRRTAQRISSAGMDPSWRPATETTPFLICSLPSNPATTVSIFAMATSCESLELIPDASRTRSRMGQ